MSTAAAPATYRDAFEALESGLNGLKGSFYHERRLAAWQAFERLGLPGRKVEDWKYTPLGAFAGPLRPAGEHAGAAVLPVAGLEAWRVVFVNGRFDAGRSELPPDGGLSVAPLSQAIHADPDGVATWFDDLSRTDRMPFAALNSALYGDGACIRVARGTTVDRPVLIVDECAGLQADEAVFPRHLIVAERGASVRVLHAALAGQGQAFRAAGLVEVFAEGEARVTYEVLQDGDAAFSHVNTVEARVAAGARFDARSYALGGALVRNDLNVVFAGEHAEADLRGCYLALGEDLVDHHLILDHAVPNGYSNQLFKGVMDDRGTGVFNGKIFVRKDAQKTNAYQSNKNLLLSPKATINTKPQLEIFADDVRCSHGATSGQLDAEALFYLRARGIPARRARTMLLRAFAGEVLSGRPEDAWLELVAGRLDARLDGERG